MNIAVSVSQKIRRKLIVVIQEQVSPKRIAAIQGEIYQIQILEGGKQEQIIEIIIKKVKKGKELSTIASEIEEEEQDVKPLYDAVVAEAPDYNMDKIKSRLK